MDCRVSGAIGPLELAPDHQSAEKFAEESSAGREGEAAEEVLQQVQLYCSAPFFSEPLGIKKVEIHSEGAKKRRMS
jgi:hypothetical protein